MTGRKYLKWLGYRENRDRLLNLKTACPFFMIIYVSIKDQELVLFGNGKIVRRYPISTAQKGVGNQKGSHKTPTGAHYISEKIGKGAKLGTIFEHRKNTARVATDDSSDAITTRILRLKGLEPGINKGKGIDTFERCVYIHGTPREKLIGKPASKGCIRVKNIDIVELFNLVNDFTLVEINE